MRWCDLNEQFFILFSQLLSYLLRNHSFTSIIFISNFMDCYLSHLDSSLKPPFLQNDVHRKVNRTYWIIVTSSHVWTSFAPEGSQPPVIKELVRTHHARTLFLSMNFIVFFWSQKPIYFNIFLFHIILIYFTLHLLAFIF